MFKQYTGCEYLMIDAATQFGLDKKTFEERIEWTRSNLNHLEKMLPHADNKPLFLKAVYAIRDTQAGKPTGHMTGLDSCASGIQIMSAVMGCEVGARNTGLIDPDKMPDAYTTLTQNMKHELGHAVDVSRDDAKQALMTFMYGSKQKPKEIFEEGSAAYKAFFVAAQQTAPEAFDLRNILINAWQPFAMEHSWKLPDGFYARIKVMSKKDTVIKVPELNSSFTHTFTVNEGQEAGLSLAANVIHSIDGYIMREINRRCNYNEEMLIKYIPILQKHLQTIMYPSNNYRIKTPQSVFSFETSSIGANVHSKKLLEIANKMLSYKPFAVVGCHDEFKAHPNNLNIVRYWYKEILAELADSDIMQQILQHIYNNSNITLTRASDTLGDKIRESNYGIA